jgi:hypothetical protein
VCFQYAWVRLLFLPLSLEIPDELKRLDRHCLQVDDACVVAGGTQAACLVFQRYPPARCLKSCREPPFRFTTWLNVVAWALAEAGPWTTEAAAANAHSMPFLHKEEFIVDLRTRARTLQRASADSVGAHRACAMISSYMLLPYLMMLMLVLAVVTSLTQAMAAQLFPLFLILCSLASAIVISASCEEEERRMLRVEETMHRLQTSEDGSGDDEDQTEQGIFVADA